jgi:hypothetical protein
MSKKNKSISTKTTKSIEANRPAKVIPKEEIAFDVQKTESWLEQFVRSKFKWIILVLALVYAGSRFTFYSSFKDSILYAGIIFFSASKISR